MRDEGIKPVYVHTTKEGVTASDEIISFDDVFNSNAPTCSLQFNFESKFPEFLAYSFDSLESIDLVVCDENGNGRALEVKLTVLPDDATSKKSQDKWGCELVIRPVSVRYAALTIYQSLKHKKDEALPLIEKAALAIDDWTNASELLTNREQILKSLDTFLKTFTDYQVPLVLQPVWKTQGKLPELADQAFDIFVWSNMALCRLFLNQQLKLKKPPTKVSRHLRASARLLRNLYDLFSSGKMRKGITAGMAMGKQTDKEFAAGGAVTNRYMKHPRLLTPRIHKSVISKIILNGGEKQLSPERRFDATIYFTASELFGDADPESE
jgi:hypothetical protein